MTKIKVGDWVVRNNDSVDNNIGWEDHFGSSSYEPKQVTHVSNGWIYLGDDESWAKQNFNLVYISNELEKGNVVVIDLQTTIKNKQEALNLCQGLAKMYGFNVTE